MNRNCMAAVVRSDELRHHGVMGMEWGERHGPPYPLGGLDKKVARAEAKRKKARERALEKARKAAKKQRKAAARELKLEAKQAKKLQKDMILKEKLLADADLDAIKKHRRLFTTQELNDAIIRARVLEEVKTKKPGKKSDIKPATPKEKVDMNKLLATLAGGAVSVATIAKAGIDVVNLVNAVRKATGQTPAQNAKAGPKEIDALAKAFSSSKSEGGSAKVDAKSETASKKPDSTAKEAAKEVIQQLPKSVQSVLPQELIDSFSSESSNARTTELTRKRFFGLLGKTTQTTPEFWDSVARVKVDQMYKKPDSTTPTKKFYGQHYKRDVYDTERVIGQERRITGGSSLTEKKRHASRGDIVDLYSPDAETSRKSWLAPYALELTVGSEKLSHDIEKMIEPLRGIKLNSQISSPTGISSGSGSRTEKKAAKTDKPQQTKKQKASGDSSGKGEIDGLGSSLLRALWDPTTDFARQYVGNEKSIGRTEAALNSRLGSWLNTVPLKDISTGGNTKSGSSANVDIDALLKSIGSFKL